MIRIFKMFLALYSDCSTVLPQQLNWKSVIFLWNSTLPLFLETFSEWCMIIYCLVHKYCCCISKDLAGNMFNKLQLSVSEGIFQIVLQLSLNLFCGPMNQCPGIRRSRLWLAVRCAPITELQWFMSDKPERAAVRIRPSEPQQLPPPERIQPSVSQSVSRVQDSKETD